MKEVPSILSANGSVEIGFGLACLFGGVSYYLSATGRPPITEPAILVTIGAFLLGYGCCLRRAWNADIRRSVEELKQGRK